MSEWHLFIGRKFTGIVVRPDGKYPDMYRVHRPGRPISDMVNLARAKDAALAFAHIGGGVDFYWDRRQTPSEGALVA